jgi:pimeloyl-ACP methyl ester carboxylesterase
VAGREPDVDRGTANVIRRLARVIAVLSLGFALSLSSGATASGLPATTSAKPLLVPGPAGRALGAQGATRAAEPCGQTPGLECTRVDVPLDRTGLVPGTISLHVEVLRAEGMPRGVVFLIAGGPGQGSAHVYGLQQPSSAALYRFIFPGYTLVAYDDRGTGDSGLINCPNLQTAITADAQRAAAAACAAIIGPSRDFYSTGEHAEDLEAVRAALGAEKIVLFGVSYGTKLAAAYALAHPDRVERLLLDSVVPPDREDPFSANVLRGMPAILSEFCSDGGCRAATRNFGNDVAVVANRLAAKPLEGTVVLANGKTAPERLEALTFLSIVLDADLSPGLAALLPSVVGATRAGNTQPLLRLSRLHRTTSQLSAAELSFGLYAATVCRDGPFPWQPDTPVGARAPLYTAAVAALPAGSFGPFGAWAARFGNADFCLDWPSPSGGAPLGAGPLPDVPVLALSGSIDMRTPTSSAVAMVSRFPQGRLLVVPGVGHSVVGADASACAARAVRSWMNGEAIPDRCPRPKPLVAPVPALPRPGVVDPARLNSPLVTYAIASKTIREATAMWLMAAPATVPGIYGGRLAASTRTFTLTRYSIARGVTLTGRIRLTKTNLPLTFEGTVTVAGPAASAGILGLQGASLRGTLGGRVVGR